MAGNLFEPVLVHQQLHRFRIKEIDVLDIKHRRRLSQYSRHPTMNIVVNCQQPSARFQHWQQVLDDRPRVQQMIEHLEQTNYIKLFIFEQSWLEKIIDNIFPDILGCAANCVPTGFHTMDMSETRRFRLFQKETVATAYFQETLWDSIFCINRFSWRA